MTREKQRWMWTEDELRDMTADEKALLNEYSKMISSYEDDRDLPKLNGWWKNFVDNDKHTQLVEIVCKLHERKKLAKTLDS